jgi:non-ribosomal peptide synthetase component F
MEPSDRLVITLLAVWKTGAAYLPLDPSFPSARVGHILSEAQPVLVVTDEGEFSFTNIICHHHLPAAISLPQFALRIKLLQIIWSCSAHSRALSSMTSCTNKLLNFHQSQCLTVRP